MGRPCGWWRGKAALRQRLRWALQVTGQARVAGNAPVAIKVGAVVGHLLQSGWVATRRQTGHAGMGVGTVQHDARTRAGKRLQGRQPIGCLTRGGPTQQVADGAVVGLARLAVAHLDRRKAQPQRMAGPGHGHIEQAQVVAQALLFVAGLGLVVHVQHQLALASRRGQQGRCDIALVKPPKTAGKRQAHHRVFQPLAFVDGDDLDQVGIAFQAHHLLVALLGVFSDLVHQPADKGLLALQIGAGVLQQFGQVQVIGQAALAAIALQPARSQPEAVDGLAQHGQHALAGPDLPQRAQGVGLLVKPIVLRGQPRQHVQRQPHAGQRQRGAHQGSVLRGGHGAQPMHQVAGLVALEHRILVRQIHRCHVALLQGAAHGSGLGAGAHQDGNVLRAQALQRLAFLLKTVGRIVQPHNDLLGAALGKGVARVARTLHLQVMHQRDGGHGSARTHPLLLAPVGCYFHKGQGVAAIAGGKLEGATGLPLLRWPRLGLQKTVVDGLHQRMGRAVIDRQRIVPPCGGTARLQVAVNVRATKTVNGLFGVANQQQSALGVVVWCAVNLVKDAVLEGRGVLELVNQRHRVLGSNAIAQALAAGAVQRGVQALKHVGKTERALLLLELAQALRHAGGGVATGGGAGLGQVLQGDLQGGEGIEGLLLCQGQMHRPGTVFANVCPGRVVQARPARGQRGHHVCVLPVRPVLQLV